MEKYSTHIKCDDFDIISHHSDNTGSNNLATNTELFTIDPVPQPHHPRNEFVAKYYALFAICAGIIYGSQLFIQSLILEREDAHFSFTLFLPLFVGYGLTGVIYHIKEAVKLKKRNGVFWLKENSGYFKNSETKRLKNLEIRDQKLSISPSSPPSYDISPRAKTEINWYNVMAVTVRSILSLGGQFIHMAVLHTADMAKINFSIILNLYSLTPFLTAILFFLVFREKLNKLHILGMVMIFSCIVITSESNNLASHDGKPKKDDGINILIPIGCALVATCAFTITNFSSRYFTEKGTLSSQQLMSDSCMFQAIVMIVIFVALPNPFDWVTIVEMGALSIVGAIGNFMVNESIVHGKAGPTSALCEIQSLWLLVLEIFILGKIPNYLQIIGFVLGILGGSFIAFGSVSGH